MKQILLKNCSLIMIKSNMSTFVTAYMERKKFLFLSLLKVFLNFNLNGKGPFITKPLIHKSIF